MNLVFEGRITSSIIICELLRSELEDQKRGEIAGREKKGIIRAQLQQRFVGLIMKGVIALFVLLMACLTTQADIFSKYYQESRKIAQAMTIDELAGQMIQADFEAITTLQYQTRPEEAVALALGSLLVNANGAPADNGNIAKVPSLVEYQKQMDSYRKANATNWKKLTDRFQNLGVTVSVKNSGKYKIKFLLGTDAVHGDQHTVGTILFPHNIGLSCSHNEANFENVGFWTKEALKKSGFNYAFAPTVAVSHNPQWGRFYESMGQEDDYIQKYAQSYVKGLQDVSNDRINGVLGSAKHFFGDGSTLFGCNMGNANVMNFRQYIDHNSRGFKGSVSSNVGSVMASYSAINWIPNAINSEYLLGLLREDLKFNGFTISDYNDVQFMNTMLLPRTFMNFTEQQDGYAAMVNGGIDMFMVQHKALVQRLLKHAKKSVEKGYVPQVRLVEAVTRILTVKMAMGLVEKANQNQHFEPLVKIDMDGQLPSSSSGSQYQDSLTAVRQSLVLLKNNMNSLPVRGLASSIRYVVLIGQKIHNINRLTKIQLYRSFDNIGMQSGGWSVRWQGVEGNEFWTGDLKTKTNASSILDALQALQKTNPFELVYANYSNLNNEVTIDQERTKFLADLKTKRTNMNSRNTIIIGTFGEFPYAESDGDVNIPYCQREDKNGCLYNPVSNPYAPGGQLKTLKVDITKYDKEVLSTIKEVDQKIPLISVLLSGRPMIIDELLSLSDATLAAWLPGTSGGQGIVDAISGAYTIRPKSSPKKNTLSVDWPKSMSDLSNFPWYDTEGRVPRINDRLFSVGDGLSTDSTSSITQSDV